MPITPMLAYDDAPAAIAFLTRAFGFKLDFQMDMPDGRIGHAALSIEGAPLALSSVYSEIGHASPASLPGMPCQFQVDVADVDAHHAHAVANGATIIAPPADQAYGSRTYRAVDPEGHKWIFSQHQREVPRAEVAEAYDAKVSG